MKVAPLDLKPTQFSVGMREVEEKISVLRKLGKHTDKHDSKRLQEFLHENKVPVIRSSAGLHIIDHHHLVRACWEAGIELVHLEERSDLSHLRASEFWKRMIDSRWAHLYDQFGSGPHPPETLPMDVRGLADDPYRSLAWAVRHSGGYVKSDEPFSEFKWADFFRGKIRIEAGDPGFKKAVRECVALAHSAAAKHLPGYRASST